jgi:Tfp pilus assembly protein PilO
MLGHQEVRSMIDMIKDAETKELVIVSLFLLPILLGAWSIFLNSLDFLDQYDGWKLLIICFLLSIYVVGLIYMKKVDTQEDKLKGARYHIETRLQKRGGHRASFDAIRKEVKESYSDDFLRKLIDVNPEIFGTCTIKKGNKPGITLVTLETEDTQ